MSTATLVGWVFFVLNILFACILFHGTYQAYQRRNQAQWSARHFHPLIVVLCWSILYIGLACNLQLLGSICDAFEWPFALGWCLNNIFVIGFLAFYIMRTWLIHYDYHCGVALYNLVTNNQMTEEIREHMQWFLDNKINYGSPKYLFRFAIAVIIGINFFLIGWSALSTVTFYYGMVFMYLGFVVISIGITKKLRELNDDFAIQMELVNEYRVLAMMVFVCGFWVIFAKPMGFKWATFLLVETSAVGVLLMGLIATWRVLKRTKELGFENELTLANGAAPINVVLADASATGLFIEHLTREIMVENIFFLSDVMAYKQSFVEYGKLNGVSGFTCRVPGSLSRLMFRRTFTHYAWAITKTYVDGSSSFFVTAITDETRDRCIEFFEEQNPADEKRINQLQDSDEHYMRLQQGFDDAAVEVYKVLKDSYMRFSNSETYKYVRVRGQSVDVNQEMKKVLKQRNTSGQ